MHESRIQCNSVACWNRLINSKISLKMKSQLFLLYIISNDSELFKSFHFSLAISYAN